MLYTKTKKEALSIHEHAVEKYNHTYQTMQETGTHLYSLRQNSVKLIQDIELLLNSIANKPKEFEKTISDIQAERKKFRDTEEYAVEAMASAVKSGLSVAAGVAGGVAVASVAPSAAMWVATTFGTASTGTAISTLSGAVATKAALAWLGGGALSAGGAGVAGGQALLALAGPIGWGIASATTVASTAALGRKNKKIADEAIAEAKKITLAGADVNEACAKIRHLADETAMLTKDLQETLDDNSPLKDANYLELSEDKQYQLGAMINNTLSLAAMLNKTI